MHPAVDFVLSAIKTNWSAGSFADIPLERVDRDNSQRINGNVREFTNELKSSNFVGAAYTDRVPTPIGTEYESQTDKTVNVRIVGLHESEFGYINPDNSLPPSAAGDPVPWSELVKEIRSAVDVGRRFPDTGDPDIDYKNLVIRNQTPLSYEYGDLYHEEFDVVFEGYEEL